MSQASLSDFERNASQRAHHRALIMQILQSYPGLTHEQIREKEKILYGYTFCTDNRLRELRHMGWVDGRKEDGLLRWYPLGEKVNNK
jgi:hypothetical protein